MKIVQELCQIMIILTWGIIIKVRFLQPKIWCNIFSNILHSNTLEQNIGRHSETSLIQYSKNWAKTANPLLSLLATTIIPTTLTLLWRPSLISLILRELSWRGIAGCPIWTRCCCRMSRVPPQSRINSKHPCTCPNSMPLRIHSVELSQRMWRKRKKRNIKIKQYKLSCFMGCQGNHQRWIDRLARYQVYQCY